MRNELREVPPSSARYIIISRETEKIKERRSETCRCVCIGRQKNKIKQKNKNKTNKYLSSRSAVSERTVSYRILKFLILHTE